MTECSSRFEKLLCKVQSLSHLEKKSLLEKMVKLQEEAGELAEAILIHEKSSGSGYKESSEQSIENEAVDIILVALDIFFTMSRDMTTLEELLTSKCAKWERHQLKKD